MRIHRLRYWSMVIVASVALSVCLRGGSAQALPFSVSARGSILVTPDPNGRDSSASANTGPLAQTSTSIDLNPLPDWIAFSALARLLGRAELGALGADGFALASSSPTFNVARATGDLTWVDEITIGGGTTGDKVVFLATLALSGAIASKGVTTNLGSNGRAEIASDVEFIDFFGGGNIKVATLSTFTCSASGVEGCLFPGDIQRLDSALVTLAVGGTYRVMGSMSIDAFAQEGGSGDASFLDTALFRLDPVTPGATYTTASGVTYLTEPAAVPEPATLFLLGAGLAGMVACNKKACQRLVQWRTMFRRAQRWAKTV